MNKNTIITCTNYTHLHWLLLIPLYLFSLPSFAIDLAKVTIDDKNILLLDSYLNKKPLLPALDTYSEDDILMVAVEPLFDSLALRYQREEKALLLFKDDTNVTLTLGNNSVSQGYWADDGYYLYIDHRTLSQLFNIEISYNTATLTLEITGKDYLFPIQKLSLLAKQRQLEQSAVGINKQLNAQSNLLKDQYRLFTIPHGSFSLNANSNSDKVNSFNYTVQTVSDFLYHSTSLTVNDTSIGEATGRLNFSRYKSLPDELIVGAFDMYTFGDINSISDNLTTSTQSGLGVLFSRAPKQYRNRNIGTTITEVARPGWDAELYRNGQFIELKKVPLDGNLVFEDVETQYGNNRYEIKLYGPFGEKEVRYQNLTLDDNALAEGEIAYNFYGLDNSMRLINNQHDDSFTLNNSGAAINYGITNHWLMGLNVSLTKDNAQGSQQYITLRNALAFPGLLFNNEVSFQKNSVSEDAFPISQFNDNRGYAQITSLSGNAFGQDTFNLIYESSDNYQSSRINSANIKRHYADFTYSGNIDFWNYNLGVGYTDINDNKTWQARNSISRNILGINFSNNIYYNRNEFDNMSSASWNGTFVAAGAITNDIRLSSAIDYRLDAGEAIRNASVSLGWNDRFNLYHNFRGTYQLQEAASKWQLNYNLSWNSDKFQLQLATNYNAESDWSVGLGIRFFLGYDYHNQKAIFSNQLASNSATINSHSYLDRNPNGWRDEGDLDLQGVKFSGSPAWQQLSSGKEGHTILPGVATDVPFKFNAQWEYGTKALAKDFIIYTHPGAYIDINMPFYVTTDFSGFITKLDYYQKQIPLTGVMLEILNSTGETIGLSSTDIDGYYQFASVLPGIYHIRISQDYLLQSGYTGKVVGYNVTTPASGGIVELDSITLQKVKLSQQKMPERLINSYTDASNTQANIWIESDDPNHGKVFSMESTRQYSTQQSSLEPDSLPNKPITRLDAPKKPVSRIINPQQPISRTTLPVTPVQRNSLPITPITRSYLPVEPVTREIITPPSNEEIETRQSAVENEVKEITAKADLQQSANKVPPQLKKFTIQLGVYSNFTWAEQALNNLNHLSKSATILIFEQQGKTQYKLLLSEFSTAEQAKEFAESNLPQTTNYLIRYLPSQATTEQNFVIQLISGMNRRTVLASANKIKAISKLYLAEKQLNGKTWYCLISRPYKNRYVAEQALLTSKLSAWVTDSATFNNVIAVSL